MNHISNQNSSSEPEIAREWSPSEVRELRVRLGLSQTDAARRVGVGKSMWCHWEKGYARVTDPFRLLLTLLNSGKLDVSLPPATMPEV